MTALHWLDAFDLCVQLLIDVRACLTAEREAVIYLRTEEILQCTQKKEQLMRQLQHRVREVRGCLKVQFGDEKFDRCHQGMNAEVRAQWQGRKEKWDREWEETRRFLARNQGFLELSLKTMGRIADNLKRCLGEKPTYAPTGKRRDAVTPGKVLSAVG